MTKERIAVLEEMRDLITAKADDVESIPADKKPTAYCALIELRDEVDELIHASMNARRERIG